VARFPIDATSIWRTKALHSSGYHRFKIAQIVTSLPPATPPGLFVILRLLPHIGGEPHYTITSTIDGHQRTLPESQIGPVPRAEGEQTASVHLLLSMDADDDATVHV
jgi:hypothetical protein